MAVGILNLAQKLEADYNVRNLDIFFVDALKSQAELWLKYTKDMNQSWSWFHDTVWCPQDISFSGSTVTASWVDTILRNGSWFFYCSWNYDGDEFWVYFNPTTTDTEFLQFRSNEIFFRDANKTGTLWDGDATYVDGTASFPLISDAIDDDYNSDNYRISSTGSILYPDGYTDDDSDARLKKFWYTSPGSSWNNVFWSYKKMQEYISENTNNIAPYRLLDTATGWVMYIDVDTEFELQLIKIDRNSYDTIKQLKVLESFTSATWSTASIWYLQDDMTLAENITWNEYIFDFTSFDYALFIKNNHPSNTLFYQIELKDTSWVPIYHVPIHDDSDTFVSYLAGFLKISEKWFIIGQTDEIFQLK